MAGEDIICDNRDEADIMHRKKTTALLATLAMAAATGGFAPDAHAGSSNGYSNGAPQRPSVTTFIPAPPPVMETYAPATVPMAAPEPVKDGYYDESRYGGNAEFGYQQRHACGGATTGEKCLVILSDHMRRVRLDAPAGTILVGNPLIADVTVLGNDTMFVSARSIGSTNIIVLDKSGNELATYEVFVREPRIKRVVLNNAGVVENYQCAPHCERALTQSDSPAPYNTRAGIISTDLGLDRTAIGLQSGPNPNTEAPAPQQPAFAPQGTPAAAQPGAGLTGSVGGLGASLGPALGIAGAANGLLSGGGGQPAAPAPARVDAPPLDSGF